MRRSAVAVPLPSESGAAPRARSDAATLRKLLPYLWRYRGRVALALAFMIAAKGANVGVPVLLKQLIDGLAIKPGDAAALLVVPVGLLLAYAGCGCRPRCSPSCASWSSPRPPKAPRAASR
jgi:hypothetical protein